MMKMRFEVKICGLWYHVKSPINKQQIKLRIVKRPIPEINKMQNWQIQNILLAFRKANNCINN